MKVLRHSLYNLIGLGLPLLVAVFSIPLLIEKLGAARFGLLTLIWAVVSYFGLFDLGLGRALTQQLAVALRDQDRRRVAPLVATASTLMAALGVFAGLLMAALASWGVSLMQAVPDNQEAIHAVYWMAVVMPAIVLTSGFRGILEAKHQFGIINLIRLPMGLFTFLGPAIVVLYGEPKLDVITAVLALGRVVACIVHAWYAWRSLVPDANGFAFQSCLVKPLCVSGGWLTLSNVISPFMGYVDRFIIGVLVSAAAVAYYTTPQELVTKLWILPGALTAVLFPTFAAHAMQQSDESKQLFNKAVFWLFCALLPLTTLLALFSHEILVVWVGEEFAGHSAMLLQIFALGILVNSMAHVPFTLIQGAGAPRLTALIHAAELPVFIAVLWWLTMSFGINGAAMAWFLRMLVDAALMFLMCKFMFRWPLRQFVNLRVSGFIFLAMLAYIGVFFDSFLVRLVWLLVTISISLMLILLSNQALKKDLKKRLILS